jgi:hypothetical protein
VYGSVAAALVFKWQKLAENLVACAVTDLEQNVINAMV